MNGENGQKGFSVAGSLFSDRLLARGIPTRLASTYDNLNIVLTTEPVPHMGLSASPDVPAKIVEKIRQALLNATTKENGKLMLAKLKMDHFEPASSETYDGYANLLKEVFGYSLARQ